MIQNLILQGKLHLLKEYLIGYTYSLDDLMQQEFLFKQYHLNLLVFELSIHLHLV